jgi:hypothetical protein
MWPAVPTVAGVSSDLLGCLSAAAVAAVAGGNAGASSRAVRSDLCRSAVAFAGVGEPREGGWRGGRRLPYQHMDLSAICRLPVVQLAAADSVLAIWVNGAEPEATLRVVKAWGLVPS